MIDSGIRFETIGDLSRMPDFVLNSINKVKEATQACTGITMILAINYGARDEFIRCIKKIGQKLTDQALSLDDINEDCISEHLDTKDFPDPELFIGKIVPQEGLICRAKVRSRSEILTVRISRGSVGARGK